MSKDNQKRIVSKCFKEGKGGFSLFAPKNFMSPKEEVGECKMCLVAKHENCHNVGCNCTCHTPPLEVKEKCDKPFCECEKDHNGQPIFEVKEECQCKRLIPKNTNIVHTHESCGVKSPTEEQLKHFWSKDIEKCPCGGDRDKSGKCTKEVIDLDTSEDIEKEELIEKLAMAITHSEQGEYAKNERYVRDLLSQQEAKIEHCSVEDCPECNIGAFKAGEAKIKRELVEKFESMINSEEQLCGMSKNQAKEVIMNLRTQLSKLLSE